MKKLAYGIGLLILPVALLVVAHKRLAGLGSSEKAGAEPTAEAQRRDIETTLLMTGEVVPAFQVEIKAEVGGKVAAIHVTTGQKVSRGQLLVTMDDTELRTEKAAAETEIEGARLVVDKLRGNYERARALFEEKLISKEVYDNLGADLAIAENTLEKARARLRTVEDRLSKTRIQAPADGTILDILVNEGQVVVAAASINAGTVLMSFADLSRLLIHSHVNQVDAPSLHVGQKLSVAMPGGETLPARVEFIAPIATIRNNIKGFQVQALLEKEDPRLKPGMSVSMTASVARAPAALAVPVAGIFREDNRTVVYVRKAGGIERREVEVGISDLSFAEIRSGLVEGEEVLLVRPQESGGQS